MAGTPRYAKDQPTMLQFMEASYNVASDVTGKVLFTLPKGARIIPGACALMVQTAFDGTTPTVLIGTSGDTDAIAASADVAPATAGLKALVLATLNAGAFKAAQTSDIDIIATVGGGGSNTAGLVYVTIAFAYPYRFPSLQ